MARPTGRQSITAGRSSARRRTDVEGERRRRASHHVTAFGLPDERPLPFASSRVPRMLGVEGEESRSGRRPRVAHLWVAARFWFGSGIMLLGFTDEGEARPFTPGDPPPAPSPSSASLGVHPRPLAMRANNVVASSAVTAGSAVAVLPPALQPNTMTRARAIVRKTKTTRRANERRRTGGGGGWRPTTEERAGNNARATPGGQRCRA